MWPLHVTRGVHVAGILLGIAIRTGSPLSLNLAEPVWKQLAGMPLSVADLMEVDKDYVPGMYDNTPSQPSHTQDRGRRQDGR